MKNFDEFIRNLSGIDIEKALDKVDNDKKKFLENIKDFGSTYNTTMADVYEAFNTNNLKLALELLQQFKNASEYICANELCLVCSSLLDQVEKKDYESAAESLILFENTYKKVMGSING